MTVLIATILSAAIAFALGTQAERGRWIRSADEWGKTVEAGGARYDVLSVEGWKHRPRHKSDPQPDHINVEGPPLSSGLSFLLGETDDLATRFAREQSRRFEEAFFKGESPRFPLTDRPDEE